MTDQIEILSGKGIAERLEEIKKEETGERCSNCGELLTKYPGKACNNYSIHYAYMSIEEYAKTRMNQLNNGRGKPAMCGPKYLAGIEYPCDGSCCGEKP